MINIETKTTTVNNKKVTYGEVSIDWEGKEEIVKIKKLSFGEMLDLNQTSSKMSYRGGVADIQFDAKAMSQNCLLKGILEAPFTVNIDQIRDLDREVGEKLVNGFNELNTPLQQKKEI